MLEGLGHFQSTETPGEEKRPYFKVNPPLTELKREPVWGFEKGENQFMNRRSSGPGSKARRRNTANFSTTLPALVAC